MDGGADRYKQTDRERKTGTYRSNPTGLKEPGEIPTDGGGGVWQWAPVSLGATGGENSLASIVE